MVVIKLRPVEFKLHWLQYYHHYCPNVQLASSLGVVVVGFWSLWYTFDPSLSLLIDTLLTYIQHSKYGGNSSVIRVLSDWFGAFRRVSDRVYGSVGQHTFHHVVSGGATHRIPHGGIPQVYTQSVNSLLLSASWSPVCVLCWPTFLWGGRW